MAVRHLYVQQISYDGSAYTKGDFIDTYDHKIGIKDIPFKYYPEFKDVTTRDWIDSDGVDVYVPTRRRLKEYDMEITFVLKTTKKEVHEELENFIDFFYYGASSGRVQPRFAMYDEQTQIGRKDIVCASNFNDVDVFYYEDFDDDGVAEFKLKFTVCDPYTDVTPIITTVDNKKVVTGLEWTEEVEEEEEI